MKTKLNKLITGLLVFLTTFGTAYAGTPVPVPEPNVLSLLIAGGIVAAIVAIRKRKK